MNYIPQLVFIAILAFFSFLLFKRFKTIRRNILIGKDLDRTDNSSERWSTMFLIAFGQKKMFKRIIPAILHFLIYVGFLVINLEVLEFVLDGILGTHRLFAPFLGDFYNWSINFFELLAVGVMISCIIFLIRRNVIGVPRFKGPEMANWPKLDANLILIIEIVLMIAILTMNATDRLIQLQGHEHYENTGDFFFSGALMPLFQSLSIEQLVMVERVAWWFHIIGILGFAVYVTFSKHLHIFLAFPNTYFSNLNKKGKMENMPVVTNEVKTMLGMTADSNSPPPEEIGRFGAKDVNDLYWVNILNAYSCTECGRCTNNCPANLTGKKLSPRKIMMDTRDRAEEYGKTLDAGGKPEESEKMLLDGFITREEINACTACNACVEACPVNIDPLSIILQLRRFMAMEESSSPASWNSMFSNIETSFSPWKFAPTDRFNWADELKNSSK